MKKVNKDPFSNGTEYMRFEERCCTFYNGCFCLNDDFDMTLISVIYDSEEFGGVKIIGNIQEK